MGDEMNSKKNGAMRKKVLQIYDFIEESLYLNRPDMEINGSRFNSALLMSLLTGLCQGRELIIGEPGLGKTTSAEYICALIYRFPLGTIWSSEVSGHPEQTEEKIIGRPDLGKLNQGEEFVIWSNFALLPIKVVDEINRLPETKQSIILNGVDRGNWEYLNDTVINKEFCLFATANYQDRATHTIIAPLVDRFDIMVESKHPGPNLAYIIGCQGTHDHFLRHEELEAQFKQVLSERIPYHERMDRTDKLCERFGEYLAQDSGIPSCSQTDRSSIRSELAAITFDLDANAFLRLVLAELSFCYHFGQKRSQEACVKGCHFTEYLCHAVKNCASNRLPMSVRSFAQALAWFMGDEKVDLQHLKAILPYTLAHRIQWTEEVVAQSEKQSRSDPLEIYMARKAVAKMHRRYIEQGSQIKNALSIANRIAEGAAMEPIEGDHPIYWEIRKDLEKGVIGT
jgi:MoxR-like ATPase